MARQRVATLADGTSPSRSVVALVAVLALLACAPDGTDPDLGGSPDAASAEPCAGGPTRCFGDAFQTCVDGEYRTEEECAAPQVCTRELGCTACTPGLRTCVGDAVHDCAADGSLGARLEACQPGECAHGHCGSGDGCSSAAELIYVIDSRRELHSFDPGDGNTFASLGQLACPVEDGGSPYSMSVDRTARAWVLYTTGRIYHVTTDGAATCTRTAWPAGNAGDNVFGMGFVSDSPGATTERLYIHGPSSRTYSWIDPGTLEVHPIGAAQPSYPYSPELTGTGAAELYAYFPGNPQVVAGIDKASGAELAGRHWELPGLSDRVMGWAFAHWGGDFYLFVTTQGPDGLLPQVWTLDPDTGAASLLLSGDAVPLVVGAGVSTCAPIAVP